MKKIMCLFFTFLFVFGMQAVHAFSLQSSYNVDTSWSTGYQVTVTVANQTSTPTSSWTTTFTLPAGQSLGDSWNGVYTSSGQNITVKNPQWSGGGTIPAGGSTTFGFIVNKPANGASAINNLQAAANGDTPTPPSALTAPVLNSINLNSSTSNSYTVSWSSVANATSYTLQRDTSCSFSQPVTVTSGASLSYSVNNQSSGTYYYRVSAANSSGTSPFSNVQSVVIQSTTPSSLNAPVLQSINNSNGSSQYLLAWNNVTNAQNYTVQESANNTFSNPQTVYQGPNTSYQVSGKAPGTYFYRVIAYAGSVTSTPSNVQSTTVNQSTPTSSAIIEGYWESWDSNVPVSTIVNMHVDVIDIAFATFTPTGNHTFQISGVESSPEVIAQLVSLAHSAGKKVKVSIGGATYGQEGMLQTTQDAVGMAQAIASYVQQNSLDGADLDIEDYPAASLQVALIQNLRQLLGTNALISYTPKTPASTTQPYAQVIQSAHSYLSHVSLMAYDYGPGYTYQQDVATLINMGVPASKIIVGLMPGRDDLNVMTSVSDITTAAQFVESQGLGGLMFWDLNRDHTNQTGLGVDAATNAAWNVFSN